MKKANKSILSKCLWLLLALVGAATVLVAAASWRWLHTELELTGEAGVEIVFEIERGEPLNRVLRKFQQDFGLEYPVLVKAYARLADQGRIKQGEYSLPARLTPVQLLELFNAGKVKQHSVTLVEGITAAEAVALLQRQYGVVKTLQGTDTTLLAARLGVDNGNLEGWLFPDTYHYEKGSSDWSLIERAHRRMRAMLALEWQQRAEGLPYKSPYEALIMASIIEKETGAGHERGEIAGVFVRRLEKRMRLQTDPTVIYGLGEEYQGNITRRHLRQKTPYNTYIIAGLPPTPIALPGRQSIHAALHPAPGSSLYFVARGDGTHVFSDTLEAHRQAVREFQLRRPENYRSSVR